MIKIYKTVIFVSHYFFLIGTYMYIHNIYRCNVKNELYMYIFGKINVSLMLNEDSVSIY